VTGGDVAIRKPSDLLFPLLLLMLGLLAPPAESQYLYAVTADGDLRWFEHLGCVDGASTWAGPTEPGAEWQDYRTVFSGGDGVIYAVKSDGTLLWFRHKGYHDGSSIWDGPAQVGSGFQGFKAVFSGGDGIIYGLQHDGTLVWYKNLDWKDAGNEWEGPNVVAEGWDFQTVFAGDGGSIYGIRSDGTLTWYKHLGRTDGSPSWEGPALVGTSWSGFHHVFASANGVIYAVQSSGLLQWYRHRGYLDGSNSWEGPRGLGTNWSFPTMFAAEEPIEGYCWPLSAVPGEIVSFYVSSPSEYSMRLVRFKREGDENEAIPLTIPHAFSAGVQAVPPQPWQTGCGWATGFRFTIPQSWSSGIYAAECTDAVGRSFRIVFVVKPHAGVQGDFAVLANTNTWSAYNAWGGKSKYDGPAQVLSFFRPNTETAPIDDGGMNRRTRAELWVLDWLYSTAYRFDEFTDLDFERGVPGLAGYKGLIITTHPEYWSRRMRDNLEAYLAGGGCLLYLGGDGMFEEVVLSPDGTIATYYPEGQFPVREPSYFRNLDPPRPERNLLGVGFRYDNYFTFAPYQVLHADHHLFAGTGVSNGELIGEEGFNGGASGWELDTSIAGHAPDGTIVGAWRDDDRGTPPDNIELLARGTNVGEDGVFGADMTYYETPAGGFVFSVGSISFGGSLVTDPVLQQIVSNALREAMEATSGVAGSRLGPPVLLLEPNQPNPFESETTIRYELPGRSVIHLTVFDPQGRRVIRLADGVQPAGAHIATWDGRSESGTRVSAGVYLYRLECGPVADGGIPGAGGGVQSGRMVLLH
jgi:hypothetical protein